MLTVYRIVIACTTGHELSHDISQKVVLLLLSHYELLDACNVLRTSKNVAQKDTQVFSVATFGLIWAWLLIFSVTVANRWETKKRRCAQAHILIKFVVSIHQILTQTLLLLFA